MTTRTENYEIAKKTFQRIEKDFSGLSMNWDYNPQHVQLALIIPAQDELDFEMNLNLQGDSDLHISTEIIWCKLYSNDMSGLSEHFYECVKGIISGKYRIVQKYSGNKMYNSLLQKPTENGDWQTIYRHIKRPKLPWTKSYKNIIQNGQSSTLKKI